MDPRIFLPKKKKKVIPILNKIFGISFASSLSHSLVNFIICLHLLRGLHPEQLKDTITDEERGFTTEELDACIKVLSAFQTREHLVMNPDFSRIRLAVRSFHELMGQYMYEGLGEEGYIRQKHRRKWRSGERSRLKALDRLNSVVCMYVVAAVL